jgi:peptidylprolyl isomerase
MADVLRNFMARLKKPDRGYVFLLALFFSLSVYLGPSSARAYDFKDILKVETVGEAFGSKVSQKEFLYYYKTAALFTRFGEKKDRDDEDRRVEAWQDLVFVKEARTLGLRVSREELTQELKRLLFQKNVEYGGDKYVLWVAANFNEDQVTFERRIEDLLLINKLMKSKMEQEVSVTDNEMKGKFLDQYNSFESEYILWANEQEARDFAGKCRKNPRLWKETYDAKKPLGQKGSSWINIMSLEALIDLWKIPREDANRILNSKPGDFIPARNYYGNVVFRVLDSRKADLKQYDEAKQKYYRDMLTAVKKHKLAQDYFNDLFKRVDLHDYIKDKEDSQKKAIMKEKSLMAIETNQGVIKLRLFPDIAPLACENFIGLVEKGFYNGIIFHRVIKDFMIQGGDPTGTGTGGDTIWGGKAFADETTDKVTFDKPGILAMANAGPDTNKSQFFITVKPAPALNGRYTIFGEVVSGMEVVNKINSVQTNKDDKPQQEQKIIKMSIGKG